MQLRELYEVLGADFDGVMSRLMKEERVAKYVRMFPANEDYPQLEKALAEQNWELAFRTSHSIKGMCLNLGFTKLYEAASAFCENVRGFEPKEDCGPLFDALKAEYDRTLELISGLE